MGTPLHATRVNRRGDGERGAAMVEFALVFVLFMVVLWGLLSYGFVFALKQSMTHAATEAGRLAIDSGNPEQKAQDVVASELDWLGGKAAFMTVATTTAVCDYDAAFQCLTVEVSYPWRQEPVIPSLFGVITPEQLSSQSTIQLR